MFVLCMYYVGIKTNTAGLKNKLKKYFVDVEDVDLPVQNTDVYQLHSTKDKIR